MNVSLVSKYDVPGPRYTSYPTVPYWDEATFSVSRWREVLLKCFHEANRGDGLSLYIHLPFCETPCTFCACIKKFTRDHAVEAPYVQDLTREWRLYLELFAERPKLRELHLGGGTPTFFSPSNLERLVRFLLDESVTGDTCEFGFEANPGSTSTAHLRAMYDLGFRRLSLGVQDLDPVVQSAINRVQPFELVSSVTDTARRIGYTSINFDLIFGLPRQRLTGIVSTIEKVIALRPERLAYYGYAHVPWLQGISQRRFCEAEVPRGAEKRALYEVGRELLLEAGYHEIGMDHFALETDRLYGAMKDGTVHRNFMGYTPLHTRLCVGLGMSAIGDAWYGFAQNEKTLEAYRSRVQAGELPFLRGHLLDEEDLVLRAHILDLMCRFETAWDDTAPRHPTIEAGIVRLSEMQADGLVSIDDTGLSITPRGRPFVRNVCMAFDARLWRRAPHGHMFSQAI